MVKDSELSWATIAATMVPVSLIWDFSWESSIGVDRFWSPPHLMTHLGVWLSGVAGAWLLARFTIEQHRANSTSKVASLHTCGGVSVGPLCAPAGAWILLWCATMIQAAYVLDAWWQRAYGLGAGMWPPPQILKAAGYFGILFGALVLQAGAKKSGSTAWHGGVLVTMCAVVLTMNSYPNFQHTAAFFLISSVVYPMVLLAPSQSGKGRWGASRTALVYMGLSCFMTWLLPLFQAHPLTPPIYNPTDRMMPPPFPLLLVAPAFAMDLAILQRSRRREEADSPNHQLYAPPPHVGGYSFWTTLAFAAAAGISFVALFLPVQWFFAKFLLSPGADNWFFTGGGRHWPFFLKIDQARVMFWGVKEDPVKWGTILLAICFAIISAWCGLQAARWLRKLRR